MQRLRHLELADRPGRAVGVSFADEQAAVEQHADGLDRVEGHAFGAREHTRTHVFREARHEPCQQLIHRLGRERLEVDRREAALAASPGGALVGQLRTGEHEHEERVRARPLEQVLQEVEQAAVGPLHVLEYEDRGRVLGEPLEEDAPGGEEVLLVSGRALLEPEQVREPRLDPGSLLRIREMLLERRAQFLPRRGRILVLGDVAAHADHLGEGEVRDAFAVGEAAPSVPELIVGEAVDVLLELPGEARLADAGDPGDRDELRLPFFGRRSGRAP